MISAVYILNWFGRSLVITDDSSRQCWEKTYKHIIENSSRSRFSHRYMKQVTKLIAHQYDGVLPPYTIFALYRPFTYWNHTKRSEIFSRNFRCIHINMWNTHVVFFKCYRLFGNRENTRRRIHNFRRIL